jgi:hypothetical protein
MCLSPSQVVALALAIKLIPEGRVTLHQSQRGKVKSDTPYDDGNEWRGERKARTAPQSFRTCLDACIIIIDSNLVILGLFAD